MSKASSEDIDAIRKMLNSAIHEQETKGTNNFRIGDKVAFFNKHGKCIRGVVTKVNRKTINVESGLSLYRVSPSLLKFQF